jgi:predicted DNA-binding transcriptional regulator YafY
MNRLERMYAIHEELRRRAPVPVSASSLAALFDVTRRTIERDLSALRFAGIPVDGNVGRTGGYFLEAVKGSVMFSLGPEEVVALLLATRAASGMPFAPAAETATRRLLDALPDATRVGVEQLRGRVRVGRPELPRVRPSIQRTLECAVRDHIVTRLRYIDADGVMTDRAVEAHGFYRGGDGWYLIGWCRVRRAGRIFRLDRVARAANTKEVVPDRVLDDLLGWVPGAVERP